MSQDERDEIGQACEVAWRELRAERHSAALSAELAPHELDLLASTLQKVPIEHRPELIRLSGLPYHLLEREQARILEEMPEGEADQWTEWLHALKDRRETLFRIGQIPETQRVTPQGERDAVIEAVAKKATEGFGIEIKPSFVAACWDEYRAFEAEVSRDVFGPESSDV